MQAQTTNNAAKPKEAKLWGGRFEEGVTDAVERFTESVSYDKQLYKHDIRGSIAHASMLAKQVGTLFFFYSMHVFFFLFNCYLLIEFVFFFFFFRV